ncbi:unnamed protein product [Withania somnifera]
MGKISVAMIVSLWVVAVSILLNRIVPEHYMDEIFHIPQAQQYCKGNFRSWDPMITTPPGLYIVSLAYVASLFPGLLSMKIDVLFADACSSSILRSTNGVLAVFCSILVYNIFTLLRPSLSDRKVTLRTVVLALYPLHWFFTFLYYTDVASLTAVLASYLMRLKKKYIFSSLVGALAVLIRQTNIIWILLYIAHPYLVADNRHYPFYLWRKVIKFHWSMKYILVPLYIYSWISVFNILAKSQRKTWILVYFLATAATLIPAPLIEFRYYTIPFFFLILHSHVDDDRSWLLMGILYVAINIFTMYMFLYRPFSWAHETGVQRFIW